VGGVASEVAPLREIVLGWPSSRLDEVQDPDAWLMLHRPDRDLLDLQTGQIKERFEAEGVVVHVDDGQGEAPPPNHLFQRDLFFVTPEGVVLARMGADQRAEEPRFAAQMLAGLGVPILHTVRGCGTFEGADALWLTPKVLLVGAGLRTNKEGIEQVARVVAEQGVETRAIPLPTGVQHLLGVLLMVADDLAFVDGRAADNRPLLDALEQAGVRVVILPINDELTVHRGMNAVVLGPRRLVMPSRCPEMEATFRREGVDVSTLDLSAFLSAGGGLGCAVGVLRRVGEDTQ